MSQEVRSMVNIGGFHPGMIPIASTAGVETIFVDCEHMALSDDEAVLMIKNAKDSGIGSITRLENTDTSTLGLFLAAGTAGFVLPRVTEPGECIDLVSSVAGLSSSNAKEILIIPQVETLAAIENLDDIASVTGIHALLIGPNDLAEAMGLAGQPQHPKVLEAVQSIVTRLNQLGMPYGIPALSPEAARKWRSMGASYFYLPLSAVIASGFNAIMNGEPVQ